MQNNKQPSLTNEFKDIIRVINYSLKHDTQCLIPYNVFSKWSSKSLELFETSKIVLKDGSTQAKTMKCRCDSTELLNIEFKPDNQPFIQCFNCCTIHDVQPEELIYYKTSPYNLAKFLTECIGDIEKPTTLVENLVFFVGELYNSAILVYFILCSQKESHLTLYKSCENHANGQVFVIITNSSFPNIPKRYKIITIDSKGLLSCVENRITLNTDYINENFKKHADKQEAANMRWDNDSKKKAINSVNKYVQNNINNWPHMNHVQIRNWLKENHIDLLTYTDSSKKSQILKDAKILEIIAKILRDRGEAHRISGSIESRTN